MKLTREEAFGILEVEVRHAATRCGGARCGTLHINLTVRSFSGNGGRGRNKESI